MDVADYDDYDVSNYNQVGRSVSGIFVGFVTDPAACRSYSRFNYLPYGVRRMSTNDTGDTPAVRHLTHGFFVSIDQD
jgi:hypothetical protein